MRFHYVWLVLESVCGSTVCIAPTPPILPRYMGKPSRTEAKGRFAYI